jgi:hypothetical protein
MHIWEYCGRQGGQEPGDRLDEEGGAERAGQARLGIT